MKPKRVFSIGLAVSMISTFGAAFAQNILPPGGFVQGWEPGGPPHVFVEKDLFNHIDGGAELFLEFGFSKLFVQSYVGEKAELVLELYEMTEPAAALGIYLMNAGRETPWPEIPARNSSEDAQIIAIKGRYFLKVDNFEAGSALRPEMIALARTVLAQILDLPIDNPFSALPNSGRVTGSERLIRGPVGLQPFYSLGEGDVLELNGKIFGVLADYQSGDGPPFSRLIVSYPSPDAAAGVLKNLRANLDRYIEVVADRPDGFDFTDFQKKFGRVERRDSQIEFRFKLAILDRE
ncbi:MAG: hypothetical protein NTW38_08780 [Candidatus Aminicenantes bacterium]|nr:hypothetical protein [Candidatus Aminicenantes bacterium]